MATVPVPAGAMFTPSDASATPPTTGTVPVPAGAMFAPSAPVANSDGTIPVPAGATFSPTKAGDTGNPDFTSNVETGLGRTSDDVYNFVRNAVTHPVATVAGAVAPALSSSVDAIKESLGNYQAYEKARSQGMGIVDSLKAANDQATKASAAHQAVESAIAEYKKNPTAAAVHGLSLAATATSALLSGGAATEALMPEVAGSAESGITSPDEYRFHDSLKQKQPELITKIWKGEKVAQPQAQSALRVGAQDSSLDANSVSTVDTPSIRNLMDQPIQDLNTSEDKAYDAFNEASGTDLKSLYDLRSKLQDAVDDPTNIGNEDKLKARLDQTDTQIKVGEDNVTNKLGEKAEDLLVNAKNMTKQRYAMEDVAKKVFNNESVIKGNVAHGAPETVDIDSAIRQVEDLDKPSKYAPRGAPTRLQQALGKDGATALKQGLYAAQKTGQSALSAQKWVKIVAGVTTTAGMARIAGEGLDKIFNR